jgi:hypothetical protein
MPRVMRQGDVIRRAALTPRGRRIIARVRSHRAGVAVDVSVEEMDTRHEAVLGRAYLTTLAWNAIVCPLLSVGATALGYEYVEVTA